jgi:hypothetical protein
LLGVFDRKLGLDSLKSYLPFILSIAIYFFAIC